VGDSTGSPVGIAQPGEVQGLPGPVLDRFGVRGAILQHRHCFVMASGQAQDAAQEDLAQYAQHGKATRTSYVDRPREPLQGVGDVSTDDMRKTRPLYGDRDTIRMSSGLGHAKSIRSHG